MAFHELSLHGKGELCFTERTKKQQELRDFLILLRISHVGLGPFVPCHCWFGCALELPVLMRAPPEATGQTTAPRTSSWILGSFILPKDHSNPKSLPLEQEQVLNLFSVPSREGSRDGS